jgi:hypothetical protein
MKQNEDKIREAIERGHPFTLVALSGDRIKVRGKDWVFFPPFEDEDGNALADNERADFFEVWGNGKRARWIAFNSITIIEVGEP